MKNTENKIKNCRHKTQLITDYLAGELSDKDCKVLEQRLESCESCRAKYAELESAWNLTAEMLKGEEIVSRISEAGSPAGAKAIAGKQNAEDDKVIPVAPEQTKKQAELKKAEKAKKGWLNIFPKNKLSFAYLEVAASIILILAVLLIFPAISAVRYRARKVQCTNNLKEIGLTQKMFATAYDEAKPEATFGSAEDVGEDFSTDDAFGGGEGDGSFADVDVVDNINGSVTTTFSVSGSGAVGKKAKKLALNKELNMPLINGKASRGRRSSVAKSLPKPTSETKKVVYDQKSGSRRDSNAIVSNFKEDKSKKDMYWAEPPGQSVGKGGAKLSVAPSRSLEKANYARKSEESRRLPVTLSPKKPANRPAETPQFGYIASGGKEKYKKSGEADLSVEGFLDEKNIDVGAVVSKDHDAQGDLLLGVEKEEVLEDVVFEKGAKKRQKRKPKVELEAKFVAVDEEKLDKLEWEKPEINFKYTKPVPAPADTPAIGNIPVIGGLFRQKQAQHNGPAGSPPRFRTETQAEKDYIVDTDGKKIVVDSITKNTSGESSTLKKLGNMLIPSLSMARESARKISCVNNLKQIGLALRMFSNSNNEEFPRENGAAGFEELRQEGFLESPQVYICPSTTRQPAKPGEPLTEETVSYYYVGGLTEADPANLPIAFDKNGNHDKYGNILYVDGHVKGYVLKDFKKEVGKVAHLLNKKPVLITKTLTANLKLWDMKTAKGVTDFLQKHKIKMGRGSFEIEANSVRFKLPKTEMQKVEKLFFMLNDTEEKMRNTEDGLPFLKTKQKPFSTFSIDVDTASYTRVAKEIRQGRRPSSDAVRPEEFINYFDYHYRSPDAGVFGVNLEAAPSDFRPLNTVLRIGIQGKRLGIEENRPSAFTILIDTSGSMANKNRLDLVKESIPMLLKQMRDKDRISIIACGSETRLITRPVSPKRKNYITNAVDQIRPMGVTNLEKGIIYAYQKAAQNYVAGGYNRVLIFTDGISNVSKASAEEILEQIEKARKKGITNTVISVGGDGDDALLEGIADKGDGSYVFLENRESARELFEEQFSARFREIARDVKIQVEFNPKWVKKYRQVGYKNRQLAKSDFRNDTVDAGEVGAGQSVTALYELKVAQIMPMHNRSKVIMPPPDMTIATVRIRYKRADNMAVEEYEYPMMLQDIIPDYSAASPSFKLASTVAEFAEHLKYPETKGIASGHTIRQALRPLLSTTYKNDKKVKELDELVRLSK